LQNWAINCGPNYYIVIIEPITYIQFCNTLAIENYTTYPSTNFLW